ncbi:DUF3048 domain-containing protein [Desulfitibacter alkalitolerans]|uniref:DUF3048 domain-containing protein n=1 Tax=Desulfitibacter alkalitolerans TaxID=264641 RepID=UPI0004821872|nr:DUF3048 domain-containing protein [Desulfitibacter alkalitolerans]
MKNKLVVLVMIFLLAITILSACGGKESSINSEDERNKEEEAAEIPESTGIYNPLTGLYVENIQNLTAVMIDNLAPARPQSGLIHADIVYEIEAEGLLTRLMALFYGNPPEFAGPVRSARPYYMQLAKEWDAYYVHVGGCNESFAKIGEWKIRDIDDVKGHRGFFLDKNRKRPHSTYINFAEALNGKPENGNFKNWVFVDTPEKEPAYTEISFRYNSSNRVTYKWDMNKKAYMRFLNDKLYDDRESGEQVYTNNIIIQYAGHRNLQTELQHIWVDVVGKGEAEYFLGGQYYQGTWEKKSMTEPTIYYDQQGQPISLVRGKTWIQILRPGVRLDKLTN